jgi:hypothetical protein
VPCIPRGLLGETGGPQEKNRLDQHSRFVDLSSRTTKRSRSHRRCAARIPCPAPLSPPSRAPHRAAPRRRCCLPNSPCLLAPFVRPHHRSWSAETAGQLRDGNCQCRSCCLLVASSTGTKGTIPPILPMPHVRISKFLQSFSSVGVRSSQRPDYMASAAQRSASGARSARTTRHRRRGGGLRRLQVPTSPRWWP